MTDTITDEPRKGSPFRTLVAVLAGILAVVGLFASAIAVWARGTLFDSDKVARAAEVALEQPEAATSVAAYVTSQVFAAVDVEKVVQVALPANLDPLAGMFVGGARGYVEEQLRQLFEQPRVRSMIVSIVRSAHGQLMQLFEGGSVEGVVISDEEVTLNLLPVVSLGLQQLQELGVMPTLPIPQFKAAGDPAEQIGLLEGIVKRNLPDNFGQLTIFRGDAAAEAGAFVAEGQRALVIAKQAITILLIVTAAAFLIAIGVANRRRRAILALGLASAAVMFLARTLINKALASAPDAVLDPGARTALDTALRELSRGLLELATLLVIVGLAVAALMVVTGAGAAGGSALGRALGEHRQVVGVAVLAAAVAVLGIFGIDVASMIAAAVIASVGAAMFVAKPRHPAPTSAA
ncbi:MAG: hypothetical protein RI900_1834 [Actinomycetota bacterium]